MCKIEQCSRCRFDWSKCGHYDNSDETLCKHYYRPIDNSKMFRHWYTPVGRIGRTEYTPSILAAVAIYFALLWIMVWAIQVTDMSVTPEESTLISTFCFLPPAYITVVAGIKRTHDTRVPTWYAFTPIIALFFLNIFTVVVCLFGFIFLFKDEGEDGVNQHGTNPIQPYDQQICMD